MVAPIRPRRSALFLPASNPRAIAKAQALDADTVILDLEDAVAPDTKAAAREAAIAARSADWGHRELLVRVNGLETEWGADDLAAVRSAGFAGVLAPKVGTPEEVRRYAEAVGDTPLWIMVETCRAIGNLQALADCARDTPLAGFVVGTNDLALELRAKPAPDRSGLLPYLAFAVAAARSAGLAVLDGVCNDFRDAARLAAECAQGRALGFDGKTLIHPTQIGTANAAFAPDADEIAQAEAIVAAFTAPEAQGRGAIQIDGRMVERLHLAEAERTLALASAIRS